MESKINLQLDIYDKILKAKTNYKKTPKQRLTEPYVQTRLEVLETLWSEFQSTHKILVENYGATLKEHEYTQNGVYDSTEEMFIDYKTELRTILNYFLTTKQQKTEDKIEKQPTKCTQIELPKIIIPTFSGKYVEWITFRDLFLSLIHNNANLDNVQKMHYLKSYLTGEAEQLLRQIPISEANYARCWQQLTARYDNKRYLSHFILKRLLSQKNIMVESASSLKELIDTTNDCLSGLRNLGIDTSNWDIIIIHILCLKLDSESKKQWEFNITNSSSSEELPTFLQFKEFLTNRYRALEFIDTKNVFKPQYQGNSNNLQQNTNNSVKFKSLHVIKPQCSYCSDAHYLSACKKFAKETVDQRRNFVQTKNLCFNCMGANHGAKTCQINIKCKLCHRRHHTLLHPKSNEYVVEATGVKVEQERISSTNGSGPSKEAGNAEKFSNCGLMFFVREKFKTGFAGNCASQCRVEKRR